MGSLWLLKGPYEAPGWKALEADSRANRIDLLLFDRAAWALAWAPEPPDGYAGLDVAIPADGLYLDDQGRGVYVAEGRHVQGPEDVLDAVGAPAAVLLERLQDPDVVLERLGRVF